ncbi:unnamed protein product [Medioppia subpectinata]|uniref:Glutathione S-transferase n=1 Tax=Medioppia subpectinata TaxID=1979941 RepID=A0A7R9LKR1_9ACAR|nr:unnamed protein product [Medioppia subpectinata]CAG2119676.1 unnamed protein product [Medioppia subpectinata]
MSIDLYSFNKSNYCRAVLMTAKHLDIDLNVIEINPGPEIWSAQFLKVNPNHNLPTLDDKKFVLMKSQAIMQYLCNQYRPDSTLYPREPKARALVDRWLNFDITLMESSKQGVLWKLLTGADPPAEKVLAFKHNLKLFDQLLGDNHYATGAQHLTFADLSLLATTSILLAIQYDLSDCPNVERYLNTLSQELPYFASINLDPFTPESTTEWAASSQKYIKQKMQ